MERQEITRFRKRIYVHYRTRGRALPWRNTRNPYHILVSEIMLQQTQVSRVVPKYKLFIKTFPTFQSLARAPFKKVLRVWQGLGYNRRALALKTVAERVTKEYRGKLPADPALLQTLPGIGHYTAHALAAFAFNTPAVFIETNIRTVFIHCFFRNSTKVSDKKILQRITETLDRENPRLWYWALMDYGAMLKAAGRGYNKRSKHYHKQSKFKGSRRELRGQILKELLRKSCTIQELARRLNQQQGAVRKTANELVREGLARRLEKRMTIV